MEDKILERFLTKSFEDALRLSDESDLVKVFAIDGPPPQHIVAVFKCNGLVRAPGGDIVQADHFEVGISFADHFLRYCHTFEVITWLGPQNIWHPNVLPPAVCAGRIRPGTSLTDILYQLFEMITYNKVTMDESDALNRDACVWARQNLDRFPVDRRPLKRRALNLDVRAVETEVRS